MTPTYSTFGDAAPPPDPEVLAGRLLWQEGLLSAVMPTLAESLGAAVARQEDDLAGVYRPAVAHAANRVAFQGDSLKLVTAPIVSQLRSMLGVQHGYLTQLHDKAAAVRDLPGAVTVPPPPPAGGCVGPPYPWRDIDPADPTWTHGTCVTEPSGAVVGCTLDNLTPATAITWAGPFPGVGPNAGKCLWSVASKVPGAVVPPVPPPGPPPPPPPPGPPPPPPPPGTPCPVTEFCPVDQLFVRCPPGTPPVGTVPPTPPPTSPPTPPPTSPPPPPDDDTGEWIAPWVSPNVSWGSSNVCDLALKYASARPTPPVPDAPPTPQQSGDFWDYLQDSVGWTWRKAGEGLKALRDDVLAPVAEALISPVMTVPVFERGVAQAELALVLDRANQFGAPNITAAKVHGEVVALASRVEDAVGWPTRYMATADMYLFQYANPQKLPTQEGLDAAFMANVIGFKEWECYTRALGNIPERFQEQLKAKQQQLSPDEAIRLRWRGQIDDKELARLHRVQGILDGQVSQRLVELSKFLPPPSDAIRFAVKDVFTPTKLGRAEMEAEFNQLVGLRETFAAQGIVPVQLRDASGRTFVNDVPLNYWLAHYDEVSPTQAFEMLHRLRPNRVDRFTQVDPSGKRTTPEPVQIDTVRRLLREVDYNPIWRDRLAAISYRVPGRIDVRRIYGIGGYGKPLGDAGWKQGPRGEPIPVGVAEKELAEVYQDQGYNEYDSRLLGWFTSKDFSRTKQTRSRQRHLNAICVAYRSGALDYQQAVREAEFVTEDRATAVDHVNLCDVEAKNARMKEAIAGLRRAFLRGERNTTDTLTLLARVGVTPHRRAEFIDLWTLQLQKKDKGITADQITRWMDVGILTRREAIDRLTNIGYSQQDAARIVRYAEIGALAKSQKEKERLARAQQREQERIRREQERAANEAARAAERRLTRFLAMRSDKHLTDWLNDGTITLAEVRDTLLLKGASPEDADRWITNYQNKQGGS